MNKLFFWNQWKAPYKIVYLLLLSLFLSTLLLYIISFLSGFKFLLSWDVISQFDTLPVSIESYTDTLINYSIDTTSYITKERYFASDIIIHPTYGLIYFSIVSICACVLLTILTRLELSLFAIGMSIFIFFVIFLTIEQLQVWGDTKKFAVLIIIIYGALGFYFQGYDKRFTFIMRLLSFLVLTILLATVISLNTKVANPFYHLANYGIVIPIILSVIFIISIAFDIIFAFLFITTGKTSGKNSAYHFIFICLLYFVNLLLVFLKKKGMITGDLFVLNVFVIYIASTILGIWGVIKRSTLFENMIPASYASFVYISFAIISTSTICYAFLTSNDPMINMFEYIILYSHMGIGLIFFLYVMYNFWELFERNISAYELVFKPKRMPFFMVRPAGFLIMISLLMQSNMIPYKHAKAGYYNWEGDVLYSDNNLKDAKEKYNEGAIYAKGNMKSNFSMATVLKKLDQENLAEEYLTNMLEKKSTDYAYANLGNLYLQNDKFFYAWFTLKEGLKKFPESGQLHTNMAMLYSNKGLWDSTFYHINKAKELLNNKEVVNTNLSWLLLKLNLKKEVDSLTKSYTNDYISFQTNTFSSNLINNKVSSIASLDKNLSKDSILDLRNYALLYNGILADVKSKDTSIIKKIDYYTKYEGNIQFYFELTFLKALKLYYSGNRKAAIELLNNLSTTASESSTYYYHHVLGLWAMNMGAYKEASAYLDATSLLDAETQLYKGIALLQAKYTSDGLAIINNLTQTPDTKIREVASKLAKIFSFKSNLDVLVSDDELKYLFLHYRGNSLPEQEYLKILQSITNEKLKNMASVEMIDYYIEKNNLDKAVQAYTALQSLKFNKEIQGLLQYKNLQLLEKQANWKELIIAAQKGNVSESKKVFLPYFLAVGNMNAGDKKKAETYFKTAIKETPLNDNTYIKAAQFKISLGKSEEAYDILVEGMKLNPSSSEILKSYILTSLKLNLTNYADESLGKLKEMVSAQEFAEFKKTFDIEKAASESQFQQF